MGNNSSKKSKRTSSSNLRPPPRFGDENEYSVNTATSVNSILITSPQYSAHRSNSQQPPSALEAFKQHTEASPANTDNPSPLSAQNDLKDGLPNLNLPNNNAVEASPTFSPQEDRNQLTVSSLNQLTVNSIMSLSGKQLDIDDCIQRLLDAGYSNKVSKSLCLKNSEVNAICRAAQEIFLSQPSLIELSPPVKILGDIHGQYTDLLRLFEMGGFPPASNYLFMGDYVDRGKMSLETICLLLCYKIKFPENFFLLRGNHESANVTRVYGFYDECKRRCNIKIWKTFVDVFNTLPIAAIVAGKIFCVHGGLSPTLNSMDEIRQIQRPCEVPDYGLLNDLLWSDPSETAVDWEDNERGVSYCFGKDHIAEFLARYDFDLVCRAHMVVEDGYEFFADRTLVTVFSAPNYCGEFDNFGAIMSVGEELLCSFELLTPADHPLVKSKLKAGGKRPPSPPMVEPLQEQLQPDDESPHNTGQSLNSPPPQATAPPIPSPSMSSEPLPSPQGQNGQVQAQSA